MQPVLSPILAACVLATAPAAVAAPATPLSFVPGNAKMAAMLSRFAATRDLVKDRFSFALIDLDGDNRNEIVVRADGSAFCGAAGCRVVVLQQEGTRMVSLFNGAVAGQIGVTPQKVGAWRALASVDAKGKSLRHPMQTAAATARAAPAPAPAAAAAPAAGKVDEAAAFRAAGYKQKGKRWVNCDDPSPHYTGGGAEVRDINGDGRPEVLITESSGFCYGNTGAGYSLVSRQPDGTWKLIASGTGMLEYLQTRGAGGWPDLQIGGPGLCFPVERFNGQKYALHRWEYDGKRCQPRR